MRVGVLGTGVVGQTLGRALAEAGQQVVLGSRTRDNEKARAWARAVGAGAATGTFAEAAGFGEAIFNCTAGMRSLEALEAAGEANLEGKILVDVANPLDFSRGMPPTLSICNGDSLAEAIQRRFPGARVVKALNTMNAALMVAPGRVPGPHNVFLCGNDPEARTRVAGWLTEWLGWPAAAILDLGDISAARGTEMLLPLWLRLMFALGTPDFNVHVVRAPVPASNPVPQAEAGAAA